MARLHSAVATALAAALVAAPPAAALDVSGAAGGAYVQSDLASQDASQRIPSWSWLANASASWTPFRPGLLRLDADGQYDGSRTLYDQGASRGGGWGYHLASSMLGDVGTPISVFASRQRADFTTDVATQLTGSTLTNTYGATAAVGGDDLPSLRGGITRLERDNASFGAAQRGTTTMMNAAATQRLANALGYAVAYDGSWNDGTIANTNYKQHQLTVNTNAELAKGVEALFSDRFFLRSPTVSDPANPRFEQNDVGGGFIFGKGERFFSTLTYANTHRLVQTLDVASEEQTTHGLTYGANWRVGEDLLLTTTASASYAFLRSGEASQRNTGEQVGPGLTWTRELAKGLRLQTTANLTLGLLQVHGAIAGLDAPTSDLGHGEDGSVALSFDHGAWTGRVGYQGSWQSNLGGVPGTAFAHRVTLAENGTPWAGGHLTAEVRLSSTRRDTPLFGTTMTRELSGTALATWRRLRGEVQAGATDGLSGPLASPGFTDGLILNPGFDTHARFAIVSVTDQVLRTLSLTLVGRYLDSLAPGQPRAYEVGGSVVVGWDVGKFTLQAEDRFARGGSGDAWSRANLVFVRVLRRFDLAL